MKRLIPIALLFVFVFSPVSAQTQKVNKDPVGDWKFEAPYAPEGYTSGLVAVSIAEKKYTAFMSFTGSDYKFPCENVKFENETLTLTVYIEGDTIKITLKMEDGTRMTGNAVYSEGNIPLTLTKVVKPPQGI